MTLSHLAPLPEPFPLPPGYDRHAPTAEQTHAAMWGLAQQRAWEGLDWPDLLDALVGLGRTDIPLGRLVEGHVDALRILAQAGRDPVPDQLYGVWASRSHATGIAATATGDGWRLSGTLRFASGTGVIDRALVPVWPNNDQHVLLDLDVRGWEADESAWATTAMAVTRSHTITLDEVDAPPQAAVGEPGFYLGRRGFFPGGVGVAAVWAGGAARLADLTLDYTAAAPPTPSRSIRRGHLRTQAAVAHALVRQASHRLHGPGAVMPGDDLRLVATETRAAVAGAVRRLLDHARGLAGAAGLAYAKDLTHAVDDLELYLRQQNPDADAELLGAW